MIKQFAKPLLNPITRLLKFGVIQGSKNWVNNRLAAYARKRDLKVHEQAKAVDMPCKKITIINNSLTAIAKCCYIICLKRTI